jgi:hypothetical protein
MARLARAIFCLARGCKETNKILGARQYAGVGLMVSILDQILASAIVLLFAKGGDRLELRD